MVGDSGRDSKSYLLSLFLNPNDCYNLSMNNFKKILKTSKRRLKIDEIFVKARKGTRSKVYLSDNYAIKINPEGDILKGEYLTIKSINFKFAPRVLDFFKIEGCGVLTEKKIKGVGLDEAWRNLSDKGRSELISDLSRAIAKIHSIKKESFWWARTPDKKYQSYGELLLERLNLPRQVIEKNKRALKIFKAVADNLEVKKVNQTFSSVKAVLVHGDLIIHNLLTDGQNLTGVLDWEFSQAGDSFYDLARVVYYQGCAKAYDDSGEDEVFEHDFTTRLIKSLNKLIEFDSEKYRVLRSLFFAESIAWAVNSKNPEKNLAELTQPVFNTKICI